MDEYNAERSELDRELARLPPTYEEFLTVRSRASSRRRQRNGTAPPGETSNVAVPSAISHPLNFHLRVNDVNPDAEYPQFAHRNSTTSALGAAVEGEREDNLSAEEREPREIRTRCSEEEADAHLHGVGDDSARLKRQSRPRSDGATDGAMEVAIGQTQVKQREKARHGGEMHRPCNTRAR